MQLIGEGDGMEEKRPGRGMMGEMMPR